MKKLYVCSCCEEIKSRTNAVYRIWTQRVKPSKSEIVVICRSCNNKIKAKKNIVGVKEFIEWAGE